MAHLMVKIYRACLPIGLGGSLLGGCTTPPPTVTQSPASPTVAVQSPSATPTPSVPTGVSSKPVSSTDPQSTTPPTTPSPDSLGSDTKDPTLLSKLQDDLSNKVAIAKQDVGKTYLSNFLLSQQAEKLVKGRFTDDLKRLAPDVPTETDEYRIEIKQADTTQAVLVAIAKQPGFASYTGVAFAVEGNIPVTGICKTNTPSQTPPPTPKLIKSAILCPADSAMAN
ncbi:MAG: type IV pilin-like G/H family protein [Thermosynechococcaceae cyanobacterium]